jgi:hypothetical protein
VRLQHIGDAVATVRRSGVFIATARGPARRTNAPPSGAMAASMRLRLIFMVGVSRPFSIDQGSRAMTIMRSCA